MNENTKGRIANKLLLSLETEKLMNKEAAALLDVPAVSLSLIKRSDTYNKVSKSNWEKIHDWYNSGLTLAEWYSRRPKEEPTEQPETTPEIAPEQAAPTIKPEALNDMEEPNAAIPGIKEKAKRGPKVKITSKVGSYDKGKPSKEEIDRVLATLGIEIDVIVKLKNQ